MTQEESSLLMVVAFILIFQKRVIWIYLTRTAAALPKHVIKHVCSESQMFISVTNSYNNSYHILDFKTTDIPESIIVCRG